VHNPAAPQAIKQFAAGLADLRQAVGSPSFRILEGLSKDRLLRHSTAADAVKGEHLPSLMVVWMLIDACHEFARRNDIEVNDEDFDHDRWRQRWGSAKELATGSAERANTGDAYTALRLTDLLAEGGDVEGLRQADPEKYATAETPDERGNVEDRAWKPTTAKRAPLTNRTTKKPRRSAKQGLRERADAANRLAERGDVEGLRRQADAGDTYAADRLNNLLANRSAQQGDVYGLRQQAEAGNEYAIGWLVYLDT
jgi:hypothetical protein